MLESILYGGFDKRKEKVKMRTDLATLLRLSRVEAVFQADVILVREKGYDTMKTAKHNKTAPETRMPRFFSINSINLAEGVITMVITPQEVGRSADQK